MFVMYYYKNKWVFIDLINHRVSYTDPRPSAQRIPQYSVTHDPVEFVVKINEARNIPLLDGKEHQLTFSFSDYTDLKDTRGEKKFVIKSPKASCEPVVGDNSTTLSGFVKNRMNLIIRVAEQHTFSEVVLGYVNVELQYLPMGIEITDWFPIVSYDNESVGIGEVCLSVCVKNKLIPDLTCVNLSYISKLNKMWFKNNKYYKDFIKSEEKYGSKMRKNRLLMAEADYEVYEERQIDDKVLYLK